MMVVLIITVLGLVGYLVLGEKYPRPREVCRIAYFAGLLALLLQFAGYFDSLVKR